MLIHCTIGTYPEFQWASFFNSKKDDSNCIFTRDSDCLGNAFNQIEADNAPIYVSIKIQQSFRHSSMKLVTDVAYVPTGQAITKRYNMTLKEVLTEPKGGWGGYEVSQRQIKQ